MHSTVSIYDNHLVRLHSHIHVNMFTRIFCQYAVQTVDTYISDYTVQLMKFVNKYGHDQNYR